MFVLRLGVFCVLELISLSQCRGTVPIAMMFSYCAGLKHSSSDFTAILTALQPLIFCIKSIIIRILQRGSQCASKLGLEIRKMVEYSLQFPTLTLRDLEPLINLERCCKGVVDSKQIHFQVTDVCQ